MTDTKSGPGWSSAQWDLVNKAVTEAFGRANVAGAFLPCYGPLADSAEYVRNEKVVPGDPLKVEDDTTLKLFNLTVAVELSSEQVNEEGLSSALLAFRRAANILGHSEDNLIFNGHGTSQSKDLRPKTSATVKSAPKQQPGLVEEAESAPTGKEAGEASPKDVGEKLVKAVVGAIAHLEDKFHPGPFVAVLGNRLFNAAHTPREKSMVLPADRINPLLKGLLFRCGRLERDTGIVVSLGGSDIDIVVATPPKAQFLQVTQDAKYRFRVYEKFTWRIKDKGAIALLYIPPPSA